jgi:asparagine N-glycosylation enzyme membrane subunit Stt3
MLIKLLLAWLALSILFAWGWMRFWNVTEPLSDQ